MTRNRIIRQLVAIGVLLTIGWMWHPPLVNAASFEDVTVVATPDYVTAFTVTWISDTEIDIEWIIPPGADRVMVRAKYGEYPDDPGGGAEPTDGYLVYFGTDLTVSDTSMNLDLTGTGLYYRAWSVTPLDAWSSSFGEDFVEGISMTLLGLALLAVGLTAAMFMSRQSMLGFPSTIMWAILGAYAYTQSATPWGDWQYYLALASLLGMTTFSAYAAFGLREIRDTRADKGDYIDEGRDTIKYFDEAQEGKPKRARHTSSREGDFEEFDDGFFGDTDVQPNRRLQEIRDRAAARRASAKLT